MTEAGFEYQYQPPPPVSDELLSWAEVYRSREADPSDGQLPFMDWALLYLPSIFYAAPAPFHYTFAEAAETESRIALAAPRSHAKSAVITLAYVLYRIAVHREPYVLILSDTREQAQERLGDISEQLRENTLLLERYPHLRLPTAKDYKTKRVSNRVTELTTLGGIRLVAKGAGQSLRGMRKGQHRPTLIIGDDLENDEAVETELRRKKLDNWFKKSVSNLFGPRGGQLIVAGTILHTDSLLANLVSSKKGPEIYWKRRYSAIKKDGTPLWPQGYDLAALAAKKKEIGSRAFATEFLNEPADDSVTLWSQSWLDRNRRDEDYNPRYVHKALAIDPNQVGERDAAGLIVGGQGANGDGYCEADYTLTASPLTWGKLALEVYWRHQCDYIIIETNSGGDNIIGTLKAALFENKWRSKLPPTDPRYEPLIGSGELPPIIKVTASKSKVARAGPVSALDEGGRIHMLGQLDALEAELTKWAPGQPSPNRMDAYVWLFTALLIHGLGYEQAPASSGGVA